MMRDDYDSVRLLRMRARLNRRVRSFFEDAGFVEVETPLLAERLIPEPSIGIFATEQHHADGSARELYLTPSPELWMKRLVAAGMPRVYQLARCFRNVEEQGPFHQREFTMLEWYAVDEDYGQALDRMAHLLAALHTEVAAAGAVGKSSVPGGAAEAGGGSSGRGRAGYAGGGSSGPGGARQAAGGSGGPGPACQAGCGDGEAGSAAGAPVQRVTMARLWQDEVGCDPAHASARELANLARRLGIPATESDTWEQLFNRIFLTRIEPRIAKHQPVAVLDYPARIPTLAATAADGVHAKRWELYLAGVEVANCFQEETGRAALSELLADEARRQAGARVVPRPDLALADEFASVAACSGVAVGVDRLYALLLGLPAIAPIMACADTG